jgi:hypothetical protein
MSFRALCVCADSGVCTLVADAVAAAGAHVEHRDALPDSLDEFALVVVDRATRQTAGETLRASRAPVVVVGDDFDDDGLVALMLEAPVSHHVEDPNDRDLQITSAKLVSGDLFGLEKYVATGSHVGQRLVGDDADKRRAMAEVCAWAEAIGARRPVVHRIASVVDELLMNALIDAPRESRPSMASGGRAVLRWACDDRLIAISVGDDFGAIRQRDVIDNVRRARDERGRPQHGSDRGAGLGLYLVLANVASLVINVDPGRRTEVVCLFDLVRRERRAVTGGVRSLHVFGG